MQPTIWIALGALACAGCTLTGAKVYNIEVLHEDDGRHKYSAPVMEDWEWAIRSGLGNLVDTAGFDVSDKDESAIEDPCEVCLENMVGLAGRDSDDLDVRAAQIEIYARYAKIDPWSLTRERCVIELGKLGEVVNLRETPLKPPDGPIATPDDARDALAALVRAVIPRSGALVEGTPPLSVAEACARVRTLNLDADGSVRVLRAARLLAAQLPHGSEREELRALVRHLELVSIRLALAGARQDPSTRVRAADVRARVQAYGDQGLADVLAMLDEEELAPEVLLAIFDAVRRAGLPLGPESMPVEERERARRLDLQRIYRYATLFPEDRVRARAMVALAAVSGSGLDTLREEDWQAWWFATYPDGASGAGAPPTAPVKTENGSQP